jgi:hypothetical protein
VHRESEEDRAKRDRAVAVLSKALKRGGQSKAVEVCVCVCVCVYV